MKTPPRLTFGGVCFSWLHQSQLADSVFELRFERCFKAAPLYRLRSAFSPVFHLNFQLRISNLDAIRIEFILDPIVQVMRQA